MHTRNTPPSQALNKKHHEHENESFAFKLCVIFFTEGGGSGEESDVLSINADDSDIEGPKEERAAKAVEEAAKGADGGEGDARGASPPPPPPAGSQPAESKKDIQSDIDKSVSEILTLSATSHEAVAEEAQAAPPPPSLSDICPPGPSRAPAAPSIQQLELLELEMRARAIKALMKASDGKKQSLAQNV